MPIQYQLMLVEQKRLKEYSLKRTSNYSTNDKGIKPYLKSRMTRYINGYPIIPIGYVKTKNARMPKNGVTKYTPEGREMIHKEQMAVAIWKVQWIRQHPIINGRATVSLNDNRISLFIAQQGKCAVSDVELILTEMDCHHKILWKISKDDRYSNLALVTRDVHRLIHATDEKTIRSYLDNLKLNAKQLEKINKLRELVGNSKVK